MRRSVLLLALVLVVSSCERAPQKPRAEMSGRDLYLDARCDTCHGGQGQGSYTGPSLQQVAEHWSQEDLARYLRDPGPVIEATPVRRPALPR